MSPLKKIGLYVFHSAGIGTSPTPRMRIAWAATALTSLLILNWIGINPQSKMVVWTLIPVILVLALSISVISFPLLKKVCG
jgi:uncharacterized membrane protein YjdF